MPGPDARSAAPAADPEPREIAALVASTPATGKPRPIGFLVAVATLGSLLFGFESSSRPGEGMFALFLIAIGLLFGIAYLRHARKHPAPIMDFSLMKVPSFGHRARSWSATCRQVCTALS